MRGEKKGKSRLGENREMVELVGGLRLLFYGNYLKLFE